MSDLLKVLRDVEGEVTVRDGVITLPSGASYSLEDFQSGYYVFAGSRYYPSGGMHDFVGRAATLPEAYRLLVNRNCDWWHIVEDDRIIDEGERQ